MLLYVIDKHKSISQLSAYWKDIEGKYPNLDRHYYLLEPNYNDIDIARFDKEAVDKYVKIQYSQVWSFFNDNKSLINNSVLKQYASDFIDALALHTKTMEEIVNDRFISAIKNV